MKIIFKASLVILSTTITIAQTAPSARPRPSQAKPAQSTEKSAAKPATEAAKPTSTVPASEVVMTIAGVCPANTPAESCNTKISRTEFEGILNAVNPNIPKDQRRQVAGLYAQLLTVANEGQKLGVDKDPAFQEQIRLQAMKLLAQGAEKKIFDNSKPTQQEIDNFYTENAGRFEELSLRRIMIPKSTDKDAKPEATKEIADKIHDRAGAGEDPDKLQAEAYQSTKAPGAPPTTSLGWKRRGSMDPRHEPQIVALRSGQVSGVLEDGQGFYVYKVDAKRMVPLQTVSKDIENALQGQRAQAAVKQIVDKIKPQLNDAYFGPTEPTRPEAPEQKPPTPK